MPTHYDAIAKQYQQAKGQPWRDHVEAFTFLGLLGDLSGKAVVDLACGEGHYTRILRGLGVARVLGVDQSLKMIAQARAQEVEHPLDIEYDVQDCRSLSLPPEFDVVAAAYLLNYAASREELTAMVSGIARCLRPGGRFVTLNSNPDLDFKWWAAYRKYGFEVRATGERREGVPYVWVFDLGDESVEVENYWLPASAIEKAFRSAGFVELRWQGPRISPSGETAFEPGFWREFLEHPPVIGLECRLGS